MASPPAVLRHDRTQGGRHPCLLDHKEPVMRHFEDRTFTEMRFRDVPLGALYRISLRGRPSCWARKHERAHVHPNRMAQVAI